MLHDAERYEPPWLHGRRQKKPGREKERLKHDCPRCHQERKMERITFQGHSTLTCMSCGWQRED